MSRSTETVKRQQNRPAVQGVATLNHKLAAPTAHRHAVKREQLLKKIFSASPSRVVVFQGPAGHGKTSLMLQAQAGCVARGMLTGWISLDETDNDVSRFLGHFQEMVAGLRSQPRYDPRPAEQPRTTDVSSRTDWLVSQLLGLKSPVAVFLDDLHFVGSRTMLGFLRQLLSNSPEGIRWFLASRVVPEIGLPRLVVGDEALVIHAEELRFSQDEIRQFFELASDIKVTEAEVHAIHYDTEGWPAAVQLYRLALDSPAVRESLGRGQVHQFRELADYLADNVVARQKPRIQDFMLKTSILRRMSVALCDSVLGRNDSQEILPALENSGLFVRRVESDQRWFTYHALFSRFLRDQLRAAHPELVNELHRRAADWHRENGYLEEALHHYSIAGEHARAADVFEIWAEHLVPEGHMVTVDHWSDSVPMEELEKRPGLVVKIVWALTFLSHHRKLTPLLPLLRAIAQDSSTTGDPRVAASMVAIIEDDLQGTPTPVERIDTGVASTSRFHNFELSAVANARGYHQMAAGNYAEALQWLARGRALSDRADATFTWAYSIAKTALTLVSQGQLQEALAQFRSGLSDPRMVVDESVSTACLACGLIMVLYETDDLDAAMTQFQQYHEIIDSAGFHDYVVVAYRAIARIHDLRGEPAPAMATLDEAEQLCYAGQWPRAVRLIGWERVRRELMAGHVDRAQIIAGRMDRDEEHPESSWVRISEDSEGALIGRIRLHVHAGKCKEALKLIQPCLRLAKQHTRVHRQIKLHTLAALAHKMQGDDKLAHRSIEQALALAAPDGYVRTIVDEGEQISQLLLEHLRLHASATAAAPERYGFLDRLINTSNREAEARPPGRSERGLGSAATPIEPFTEREKKVISLMVNYLSNEQIAAAIFITRDTVKYHLKNIYGKLGVKSRLEAIRVVREMNSLAEK